MLTTFRHSKTFKPAKSNSFSNGKTQLSSGLLERRSTRRPLVRLAVTVQDVGRATCDELEVRHSENKASDTCGLVVRRH